MLLCLCLEALPWQTLRHRLRLFWLPVFGSHASRMDALKALVASKRKSAEEEFKGKK